MFYMTKVISLSDEAYNDLKALKSKDESFSDIVRQLAQKAKQKKMMDLAGSWKGSGEIDSIFKNIFEERHKTKGREIRL